MNRSQLNSAPLGSGSGARTVTFAFSQVLELVGSLTVSIRKYGSATQSLALSGSIRLRQRVAIAFNQALSLSGALVSRSWQNVYGAAAQTFALVADMAFHREVPLSDTMTQEMIGTLTPRVFVAVHSPISQNMALVGALDGIDFYTGYAPLGRTAAVVRTDRFIAITGTTHSTGI